MRSARYLHSIPYNNVVRIIVYRVSSTYCSTPVVEIEWTGPLPRDLSKFAHLHGGDYVKIETMDEYPDDLTCIDNPY